MEKTRVENRLVILRDEELPEIENKLSMANQMEQLWKVLIEKHNILVRQVPDKPEIGTLIEELCEIAEDSGARIINARSSGTIQSPGFSTVPIELTVECNFSRLEDLIRRVERAERLLRVDGFRVESDMKIDPSLIVEFKISAFVNKGLERSDADERG